MNILSKTINLLLASIAILATSCSHNKPEIVRALPVEPPVKPEKPKFINPYPPGTYEHFKAEPSYPKTYNTYKNESLLAQTNSSNSRLIIDLSDQRGKLLKGSAIALDYPISSGKSGHKTPTGSFSITEKIKDKRSNLYGVIKNSSGKTINSDADSRKDKVPSGGKFVGAPMPYWMRLTSTGIGHHIGRVPRYPASHGCIRGHKPIMPTVFSKVRVGTPVTVRN